MVMMMMMTPMMMALIRARLTQRLPHGTNNAVLRTSYYRQITESVFLERPFKTDRGSVAISKKLSNEPFLK